ncbi:uncharacterized protein [Nicotiana sylvestris]|uniref:uncharacterized protein n=1 Tax=Nicotiana sylvestris TaxID=4096 RepID=UPI00388C3701
MEQIESMFEQIMKKNADFDAQLASHNTFIRNLKVQLGQISEALNTHPKGVLPSDTVVNPKGGNNTSHAMEVTTKSGGGGVATSSNSRKVVSDDVLVQDDDEPRNELLSINVLLVEALEQMSGYAKFMKDLVTMKRSMNCEKIKMMHQVSAIIHSMSLKLEDLCALTIPCTIGSANFTKVLYDLRESINLMPYSVFKTLGIGKPRPISMRLQIADMKMKRPLGIIDDVLVRVDKFILPTDFVILDCKVDYEVPIILGIPFLDIGKALVDVEVGELTFRVGNENVVFHFSSQ